MSQACCLKIYVWLEINNDEMSQSVCNIYAYPTPPHHTTTQSTGCPPGLCAQHTAVYFADSQLCSNQQLEPHRQVRWWYCCGGTLSQTPITPASSTMPPASWRTPHTSHTHPSPSCLLARGTGASGPPCRTVQQLLPPSQTPKQSETGLRDTHLSLYTPTSSMFSLTHCTVALYTLDSACLTHYHLFYFLYCSVSRCTVFAMFALSAHLHFM